MEDQPISDGFRSGISVSIFGLLVLFLISKIRILQSREIVLGKKNIQLYNTTPPIKISYRNIEKITFDKFEDIGRTFDQLTISTQNGEHISALLSDKIQRERVSDFLNTKITKA